MPGERFAKWNFEQGVRLHMSTNTDSVRSLFRIRVPRKLPPPGLMPKFGHRTDMDITALKETQRKLEQSETRFACLPRPGHRWCGAPTAKAISTT